MIEFRTRHHPGDSVSDHQAYDEIYRDSPIQQLDSFYQWALELARTQKGQRLLDISCGTGRLVHFARQHGVQAIGVDLAENALHLGQRQERRGAFVGGDAELLPFKSDSFDRVVNLGSIEHYAAPATGIREISRVLRRDGLAIILVPNTFGYQQVLYAWRRGDVLDDGQPLQRYGTRRVWRQLLEQNGLTIQRVLKYQSIYPRTAPDLIWYLRRPRKLFQLLVSPLVPVNAGNCFVFVCARPPSGGGDEVR